MKSVANKTTAITTAIHSSVESEFEQGFELRSVTLPVDEVCFAEFVENVWGLMDVDDVVVETVLRKIVEWDVEPIAVVVENLSAAVEFCAESTVEWAAFNVVESGDVAVEMLIDTKVVAKLKSEEILGVEAVFDNEEPYVVLWAFINLLRCGAFIFLWCWFGGYCCCQNIFCWAETTDWLCRNRCKAFYKKIAKLIDHLVRTSFWEVNDQLLTAYRVL